MVDSSSQDPFDAWFLLPHSSTSTDADQTSATPLPPPTAESTAEPTDSNSEPLPPPIKPDDEQSRKRKHEQKTDGSESKKSKSTPAHMRRNIRGLITNDKLQVDTLTALKAEQDRLRRLEETNGNYPHVNGSHAHLPVYHAEQDNPTTSEQECIVLDDEEGKNEQEADEEDEDSTDANKPSADHTNADDGNDSDVQCVDDDTEYVNDSVTQKLQRLHVYDLVNVPDKNGNILINVNHPSDEPDLYIANHLCPILKPHQIGGIRFMYDNIVESLERLRTTPGLGCILAHSMGCGKTLQVITFIDVFLRYTAAKSVLVVVPINTIQNWLSEFNRWCPVTDPDLGYTRPYQLYILNESSKKLEQRAKIVRSWSLTGGTLIIGYEMFRLMVTKKSSATSTSTRITTTVNITSASDPTASLLPEVDDEEKSVESMDDLRNILINPDLVICDEGHRIKNHLASVAVALKSIKTQRRIVLTGYPLQNNLIEYWCMIDFIRPNYLGTKQEFCNMFERPILNGQCIDSNSDDRQLMRARAHVLHSLLEGFVQRRGHDVLQTDLPPKTEYVVLLKLAGVQRQLYMKFLEAVGVLSSVTDRTLNPLRAFTICCKIWNHADVLYKCVRERQDGSDVDFDLDLESGAGASSKPLSSKTRSANRLNLMQRASPIHSPQSSTTSELFESQPMAATMEKREFDYDFANSILSSYTYGQLSNGIKFEVAMTIIDLSVAIGDKVLLFSQSLLTLNKLEEFLAQRQIPNVGQNWEKNNSYYRLDGSTSGLERERLINAFNAPDSNAKLFLLSTRAGCLGINLIAANRVIVLDVSWNPCLDAQAICRVYRYGQRKHCYVYRLIADFTMEKRIYDRQIAKQGMSDRVVDELQPQNQFTRNEVENLIHFATEEESAVPDLSSKIEEISNDPILVRTCKQYAQAITKIPFTHESLLLDRKENQMTSAEKRRAQKHYQHEKQMNSFGHRSRYSSARAATYFNSNNHVANDYSQRPHQPPASILPRYHNALGTTRKFNPLEQAGSTTQIVTLRNPLEVLVNGQGRQYIAAGVKIKLIRSPRGAYVQAPDGRYFSIRQPASTANHSQRLPTVHQPSLPAPPPPLPPPPPPAPARSITSLLDEILSDMPYPSAVSSSNPLVPSSSNDLGDEIDLLLRDTNFGVPSSSSSSDLGSLSEWQPDQFAGHDFFADLLSDLPDVLPPTHANLPNDHHINAGADTFSASALPFM